MRGGGEMRWEREKEGGWRKDIRFELLALLGISAAINDRILLSMSIIPYRFFLKKKKKERNERKGKEGKKEFGEKNSIRASS